MALSKLLTKYLFGYNSGDDGGDRDRDGEARIKDGKVIDDEPVTSQPALVSSPSLPSLDVPSNPAENGTQGTQDEPGEEKPNKQGRLPAPARFWAFMEVAGRGKRTLKEYRYELKWWEKKARQAGCTVYTLRLRDIEASLKDLHPATTRRKASFLKVLAKFYLRENFPRLHTETSKVVSPRMPDKLPRDRGREAFIKLREQAKEWCRNGKREGVWVGLMLMAGLRISEIKTVTPIGDGRIQVIGKGQKEHVVPATDLLLQTLERIPRTGRGGWAQGRGVIWKGLSKAGIKKPHSLRHTYASELMRRGRRIEEIQVLLGHASVATTNIYAKSQVPAGVAELLDKDT